MHWTVGKVKITKVVELETVGSTRFILPLATNEEIRKLPWLIPHFATEEGRLKMSIHPLVVETPSRRIVVDTGLGNDKDHTFRLWLRGGQMELYVDDLLMQTFFIQSPSGRIGFISQESEAQFSQLKLRG